MVTPKRSWFLMMLGLLVVLLSAWRVNAAPAGLSGTKSICPADGDYATLTAAIVAITSQGLDGPLVLELCASYTSASEAFPITIPAFPGSSATNTVTIRPAVGATGLIITSNANQTIKLSDTSYVIFDGQPGGVGSSSELTIDNTSYGPTVYITGATGSSHNTLQYLTLTGVGYSVVHLDANSQDILIDHNDVFGSLSGTCALIRTLGSGVSGNTLSNNLLHRFYCTSDKMAGVFLNPGSSDWTIIGNSIYQDIPLTPSGYNQNQYGIYIQYGDGYVITGNIIGGSQPDGGGTAWAYSDPSNYTRFYGIYLDVGATTASSVQNNAIANFYWSGKTDTDFAKDLWHGIYIKSGAVSVGTEAGNIIGSTTVTDSVHAKCTAVLYDGSAVSYGIYNASGDSVILANNTIGGITLNSSYQSSSAKCIGYSFVGIYSGGTGNADIIGNAVDGVTVSDTLFPGQGGDPYHPQYLRGIASDSSGTTVITGNTVANLNNTGIRGQAAGIRTTAGANTITGNTVRNLAFAGCSTSTNQDAALIGIAQAATTAGDQTVAQNVVHSFVSTNTMTYPVAYIHGIYFTAPVTATNLVSRNLVHSLSMSGGGSAVIAGVYAGGAGMYQNNVVRLGIDATGAATTDNNPIYGIQQAAAASFYFNSVYLGGGPVSDAYSDPTYAFYGSTDPLTLQNNLLVSTRLTSKNGQHYAAYFATTTDLTSDYNAFLACDDAGVPILDGAASRTLAAWQTASGQDSHSLSPTALAQINFVNATGDAASVDLRVQSPTVAEAAGVDVPGITDDYAGQVRAGLTPVDIGAYAGDWSSVSAPPVIVYTTLPATTADLNAPTLTPVTVTAASGIAIDPGARPRLYFKRDNDADTYNDNTPVTDGWKWVEADGSGDSPFSFTPDYRLAHGGVVKPGDVIQYFVIAQTLAASPGVAMAHGILGGAIPPAGVALSAGVFPMAGAADSYRILGLSGVKTVCASGCDFASLTQANGLFALVNVSGLRGDLIAEIHGDLSAEAVENPLVQWADLDGGPWTLTIKPAGGVARTISGSTSCLIPLYGADRVTIDGLNSDGNSLLLRNTNTNSGSVVCFTNDASQNIVRNTTMEGRGSPTAGLVSFSTTNGVTGNDDNLIEDNLIRDRSDATDVPVPSYLISSAGTSGKSNSGNLIRNNTLKNFNGTGIYITGSNGNAGWTITGNTIYQEAARTTVLTGIDFQGLGTNTISQNTIRDLNTSNVVYGIRLLDARATTVSRNRITLATAATASRAWIGVYFVGANGTAAAVTLANNQVTISPTNSFSQPLYGIYDAGYSGNTLNAYHNTIYVGGTASGGATWAYRRTSTAKDATTLKNNIFFNGRTGGLVNHFAAGNQTTGGTFTSDYNLFAGTGATAASFMDWGTAAGGTPADFATWQASSGGDSHSYADTAANIPAASLFTDAVSGDLRIVAGSGFDAAPLPSNRGVAGIGVTDDYSGTLRSTTMPDLGAFEFTVDRTGLAGPGILAGGWGYYDTLGIASGAVIAGDDINVVDLSMSSGATLDMGSHTLNVAGAGNAHSEQQDVTGDAGFTFLGPAGVGINPGDSLPLGLTSVTIRFLGGGTTSCVSGGQTTVQHCFQINPVNPTGRNATVRFYFDADHDLNGLVCAELKAYHYDGGGAWSLVGGTGGTVTCDGANSYVEVTGVTTFSDFVLANPAQQPNAIALRGLHAGSVPVRDGRLLVTLAFLGGLVVVGAAWAGRRQTVGTIERFDDQEAFCPERCAFGEPDGAADLAQTRRLK